MLKHVLSFAEFRKTAEFRQGSGCTLGDLTRTLYHSVRFYDWAARVVPERYRHQRFDDSRDLAPIAESLGIELGSAARLLALRNAWIAYVQEYCLGLPSVDLIAEIIPPNITAELTVLAAEHWYKNHPVLLACVKDCQQEWEEQQARIARKLDEAHVYYAREDVPDEERAAYVEWFQAKQEEQLADIDFCISYFESEKEKWSSFHEIDAFNAEVDIKRARQRIKELQIEIESQESLINNAKKVVARAYRKHQKEEGMRARGRPSLSKPCDERSEAQQWRNSIARDFVARWVQSLFAQLSASNCAELARIVGGQKMTWWRWLNKETLPSANYLQSMHAKKSGKENTRAYPCPTSAPIRHFVN